MTVEQFQALPEIPGLQSELHHGEVVRMAMPVRRHYHRVAVPRRKLAPVVAESRVLVAELAYRAIPEGNLRAADLAYAAGRRSAPATIFLATGFRR